MTLNGVPAAIRSLSNAQSPEQVANFYRQSWAEPGEIIERKHGDWQILSTKHKGNFVSLHLKPNGLGTEGVLVISTDPQEHLDNAQSSLPIPRSFKVLGRQGHLDGGNHAETITLSSNNSVGVARSELLTSFTSDGWVAVFDQPSREVHSGHTIHLSKARDQIRLFIGSDPEWSEDTLVLLTWQKQSS